MHNPYYPCPSNLLEINITLIDPLITNRVKFVELYHSWWHKTTSRNLLILKPSSVEHKNEPLDIFYSVPIDEEDKVVVDYSCDPLIVDFDFQKSILSSIARVGDCIEKLYGSPQDIEGVVCDGKIYVVQTRPQM